MKSVICDPPRIAFCKPERGLCDDCLREWLNRPAPPRHYTGRAPSTIRSHVRPWFGGDQFESYVSSVFWFALAYPDVPILNPDDQMEAGHA